MVDRGGGWMSGDEGSSPELEAIWGPGGRASAPPAREHGEPDDSHTAPVGPSIAPVLMPERQAGRRPAIVALAGVAIGAMVLGGALLAARGGGEPGDTVEMASVPTTQVSDELRDSARAFLERWNAGPSTTMPLGEAGVPPHERPSTTTSTARPPARSTSGTGGTGTRTTPSTVQPPWATTTVAPTLSRDDPRLRDAETTARQFVEAIMARDCEGVWSMLSARTIEFFEEMNDRDEGSFKDSFCASLQEQEIPTMRVVPPARPYGRDGALVRIEADSEPESEDLLMLLDSSRWTADLVGDRYDES